MKRRLVGEAGGGGVGLGGGSVEEAEEEEGGAEEGEEEEEAWRGRRRSLVVGTRLLHVICGRACQQCSSQHARQGGGEEEIQPETTQRGKPQSPHVHYGGRGGGRGDNLPGNSSIERRPAGGRMGKSVQHASSDDDGGEEEEEASLHATAGPPCFFAPGRALFL